MRSLKLRRPIEALSCEREQSVCGGREHVKRPTQLPSLVVLPEQQRDLAVGLCASSFSASWSSTGHSISPRSMHAPEKSSTLKPTLRAGLGRVNSSHASEPVPLDWQSASKPLELLTSKQDGGGCEAP